MIIQNNFSILVANFIINAAEYLLIIMRILTMVVKFKLHFVILFFQIISLRISYSDSYIENDSIKIEVLSDSNLIFKSKLYSNPYHVLPPFLNEECLAWADSVLDHLSLNEKIGQFFMIDAYSNKDEAYMKSVAGIIKKYKVGGVIFMKGNVVQQSIMTSYFQDISKIPVLIAMDAEWGLAMRLDSTIKYPEQMMLGAIQDNHLIYEMGRDIAMQMRRIGVHVNFAPVIDVNNNPKNPVINSRSFGENKYNVASKGLAYMLGLQDNYILATGKHFPGHGDTDSDSHYNLPLINHSFERIDSLELFPFKELIQFGMGGIMVAHLNIPAIDSAKKIPTTLSNKTINKILKTDLNFQGIVFSDALNMKGFKNEENSEKRVVEAFIAGNDILVMPENIHDAFEKFKREVKKGVISIEDINNRCRKILALKKWVGLDNFIPIDTAKIFNDLHQPSYYLTLRRLVESSITLVSNKDTLIPLKRLDTLSIASVSFGNKNDYEFQETLSLYAEIEHFVCDKEADSGQFNRLLHKLDPFNQIIIGIHDPSRKVSKNFGVNSEIISFIEKLSENKRVILCLFTNPYSLREFDSITSIKSIIVAYNDEPITQNYVAQVVFGGIPVNAKLSVSIGEYYIEGQGIEIDSTIRFKYTIPEELGIDSKELYSIDSIVTNAIQQRAMPGCQVLCAKDEKVFYFKSFGYHTYFEDNEVKKTDLYDLASVTKISATIPAIMRLSDQGKFDINQKLSYYLPELLNTNKRNIFCTDVLTHQSRLQPWIPFYISLIEPLYKSDKLYSNEFSSAFPWMVSNYIYLNKHIRFKDGVYSFKPDSIFNIQVAENFYLKLSYYDTVFRQIDESELREINTYKYSDLGFYYLYKIIEHVTDQQFEDYINLEFNNPLGASTLVFLPLSKFSKKDIIPTENDRVFRQQIIHGYVHDPGAAMLGGVCGHAGLFSNANDLAKMMQLYLNKGIYGGERYFNESTVSLFTSCYFCKNGNRRGLGFDKPETRPEYINPVSSFASPESYGHTGFTGNIAWADPKYNMVYIFLSNRVYPDAYNAKLSELNVRIKIQEEFYKAILKKQGL